MDPPMRPATTPPAGSRRLPSIPSLPPIEIPKSPFLSSNAHDSGSALSVLDSDDPAPSSAHPSEESYATAFTSPLPGGESFKDESVSSYSAPKRRGSQEIPLVARSLAKSVSVDSFVRERRAEHPIPLEAENSTRSASPADSVSTSLRTVGPSSQHRLSAVDPDMDRWRGEQLSVLEAPPQSSSSAPSTAAVDAPPPFPYRERVESYIAPLGMTRATRGMSTGGGKSFIPMSDDDPDSSPVDDSDYENQRNGNNGTVARNRDNLRRRALAPKRSGSLPTSNFSPNRLSVSSRTSRITGSNPTGSLTNLTTKNLPIRGTYQPRPQTIQSPTLRNKLSMPATFEPPAPGHLRNRSQSIGERTRPGELTEERSHREETEPAILQVPNARTLTFAVVGGRESGKSTFIKKSLKQNGVSSGETFSVKLGRGSEHRYIDYIERRSFVTAIIDNAASQEREELTFNTTFIEVDVQNVLDANGELVNNGWPQCLPNVDGIFICYDASHQQSFKHVGELLSGYDALNIPTMVLACKSDLEKRISPSEALSTIQRYAGLVEISRETESGKRKMRRSLDLFIKMLEKARTEDPSRKDFSYRNPVSPDALNPPPSPWNSVSMSHAHAISQPSALRQVQQNEQSVDDKDHTQTLGGSTTQSQTSLPPPPPPPGHTTSCTPQPSPVKPPIPPKPSHTAAPASPTRTRSMSDLLSPDIQRYPKSLHDQRSLQPLTQTPHTQQVQKGAVNGHAPLDRSKTRSIVDIATADSLAVTLSNSPTVPALGIEPLEEGRRSTESFGSEHTPVLSPAAELQNNLENGDSNDKLHHDLDQGRIAEQEHTHGQEAEGEPMLLIGLKTKRKEPPPNPYATLEELLDKLFFVAVSGDSPSFISHFFLTFRRFATPRSVLLAMQRKMLEFSKDTRDITLAAYAQMRICNLLEQWMSGYPSDFATHGAPGALTALVKQVLKQTHTLYYGSDFLPFLEMLPTLVDRDGSWALKSTDTSSVISDESDNSTIEELDEVVTEALSASDGRAEAEESPQALSPAPNSSLEPNLSPRAATRDRKPSLPLSAKSFLGNSLSAASPNRAPTTSSPPTAKDMLSRLVKTATALHHVDSELVAQEMTRRDLELYLQIEPRDWLRHTLVSGKKDPHHDKIARFNSAYNDMHDWAVSLILCHDKVKARARQIEKLAEIAIRLRNMNNYSGLRAIVTAINQSTYPGDEVMEIFKQRTDLHKKFLSSDILLRTSGAHQSYRLALRNTKGPCIPSIEVHTSDMRRAHEGNPDFKPDEPSKIHWAKFDMLGKFIAATSQYQAQCRGPSGYRLYENPSVSQLFDVPVMDYDMQQSRMFPPPEDGDIYATSVPLSMANGNAGHTKDTFIRRIFYRERERT